MKDHVMGQAMQFVGGCSVLQPENYMEMREVFDAFAAALVTQIGYSGAEELLDALEVAMREDNAE